MFAASKLQQSSLKYLKEKSVVSGWVTSKHRFDSCIMRIAWFVKWLRQLSIKQSINDSLVTLFSDFNLWGDSKKKKNAKSAFLCVKAVVIDLVTSKVKQIIVKIMNWWFKSTSPH